jgi:hypothetical protein
LPRMLTPVRLSRFALRESCPGRNKGESPAEQDTSHHAVLHSAATTGNNNCSSRNGIETMLSESKYHLTSEIK